MNTSEVLNKAADLIEKRGWAKGNCGMAVEGPTCLEGAIGAAIGAEVMTFDMHTVIAGPPNGTPIYIYSDVHDHPAHKAIAAHLEAVPYAWNDAAQSASEVIEVLRACAVIEAAREEQDAAWATYTELVEVSA